MTTASDNMLTEFEVSPSVYGTFKERAFASLIDGLILLPLVAIEWFNKSTWKSLELLIIAFLVGLTYKLFFEYKYGATIGKKAMKLKVVNKEFTAVGLKEVLVRNIFDIGERTFMFVIAVIIYRSPGFNAISTNKEYADFSNTLINTNSYVLGFTLLTVIEVIFILTDQKRRALHDRLGETFVIKTQ
jgi:uncharacterized RDD family membrane protein YckC